MNLIIRGKVLADIHCSDYSMVYGMHKDSEKEGEYVLHIGKGMNTGGMFEVWYRPDYGIGKEMPSPERFKTLKEAEDFVKEFFGVEVIEDA